MEGNKLMVLQSIIGSQNRRLFKVVGLDASGDEELLLEHLSGTESLSKLFELVLVLLSRRARLQIQIVYRSCSYSLNRAGGRLCTIYQWLRQPFQYSRKSDGGLSRYNAVLGPWLWMLHMPSRYSRVLGENSSGRISTDIQRLWHVT